MSDRGLYHWNLDHSSHFVNPYHGEHTDTIEGLWALIRGDLRSMRGIKPNDLQKHLDVWAFRRNMRETRESQGVWISLCCAVGQMQHSVDAPS